MSSLSSMVFDPLLDFAKDSQMLINKCEKPGKKGRFFVIYFGIRAKRKIDDDDKTTHDVNRVS